MMSWLKPEDLKEQIPPYESVHLFLHESDSRFKFRNKKLIDPWGSPFHFEIKDETNLFDVLILSAGPDGEFGTKDDLRKSFVIQ